MPRRATLPIDWRTMSRLAWRTASTMPAMLGGRSGPKAWPSVATATWLATSPAAWPPMPSATANTGSATRRLSSLAVRTRPVSVSDP